VDTLEDLYNKELAELLDLERQQVKFLDDCSSHTNNSELAEALSQHAALTREQIARLETQVDSSKKLREFSPMAEIIARGSELLADEDSEPEVVDAAIVSNLQSIKHLEIAKYGSAKTYAEDLGHEDAADLLTQNLEQDGLFDRELTRMAERHINFRAADQ